MMSGYEEYHSRRREVMAEASDFRVSSLRAFYDDLDTSKFFDTQGIEWIEIGPAKIPGIRVTLTDGTRFDLHISQIEGR